MLPTFAKLALKYMINFHEHKTDNKYTYTNTQIIKWCKFYRYLHKKVLPTASRCEEVICSAAVRLSADEYPHL